MMEFKQEVTEESNNISEKELIDLNGISNVIKKEKEKSKIILSYQEFDKYGTMLRESYLKPKEDKHTFRTVKFQKRTPMEISSGEDLELKWYYGLDQKF